MSEIALFTFVPTYCPACGEHLKGHTSDYTQAHCSHVCPACRLHYQLVEPEDALRAATTSGGDLAQWVD